MTPYLFGLIVKEIEASVPPGEDYQICVEMKNACGVFGSWRFIKVGPTHDDRIVVITEECGTDVYIDIEEIVAVNLVSEHDQDEDDEEEAETVQ